MVTMDEQQRFRATAASGLAIVCLLLGAPFSVVRLIDGQWLVGSGGLASTVLLCLHALLLRRGSPAAGWTLALVAPFGVWYLLHLVATYEYMGLLWCFPGILGLYCLLPERLAWLANTILFTLVLLVGEQVLPPDVLLRAAATLLAVNLFAALLLRSVTDQFRALQRRIVTDPLTGLLNRYDLEPALEHRLASRRRADASSALLAMDLDNFKNLNDRFGHAVGDEVLRELGRCLNASVRAGDQAFRIGGEEFLIVLGDLAECDAVERAETMRNIISTTLSRPERAITVSIGVAIAAADDTWSRWMSRADDALYRAKSAGRDQVCVAQLREERPSDSSVSDGARDHHQAGATA